MSATCLRCGFSYEGGVCPYCNNQWQVWELRFAPVPVEDIRKQVAGWLGHLGLPCVFEFTADPVNGFRLRYYTAPERGEASTTSWTSMLHQQTRWEKVGSGMPIRSSGRLLVSDELLPSVINRNSDVLLAVAGSLLEIAKRHQAPVVLQMWITNRNQRLQSDLRSLAAYSYGSSGGIETEEPNLWGTRLTLIHIAQWLSVITAGIVGGSVGPGWLPPSLGALGVFSAGILGILATVQEVQWLRFRSVPKEELMRRVEETLFSTAFVIYAPHSETVSLLSGNYSWKPIDGETWPQITQKGFPLPASDIAALLTPPQSGEGSTIWSADSRQDVPYPPPSQALLKAPFKVGYSAASNEPVGIDPDGHGVVVGGSRTGKSSLVYQMLKNLIVRGDEAPGIFLVDPHLGLADAFLQAVDSLPSPMREAGIKRLRIITPDQPELIPLNLLAIQDFTWAGNAFVQLGKRIWEDYWGPRMQAALLGLFRLAHAWNQHNPTRRMGLLHTIFLTFNPQWRHETIQQYLPPADRVSALALDALLGQTFGDSMSGAQQSWVTEVVSPIISKVMALELSPWLYASMHQNEFAPIEKWIQERSWIVMRLPAGSMGREASRLVASIFYNVFDAAYRQETLIRPIPYWFVIDEAQEIGQGMRLEAMLSEGAKFGARMFVLSQSLSMMRNTQGMEAVVQSLLANTSTQAFFSPDPEDAGIIRDTLASDLRYGDTTSDLPSLHAWLRARIQGKWQPPTVVRVDPIDRTDPERVQRIIREVIREHPEDYLSPDGWQDRVVDSLAQIVPEKMRGILSIAFSSNPSKLTQEVQLPDSFEGRLI